MPRWSVPLALVLVGFALRMYRLDAHSLWIDEGFTAYLAGRPLDETVIGAALDVHPPLHFLAMNLWERLVGSSGFALRFSSVLAGTASIGALHRLARRIGGETVALVAAAALAASPTHVWYSQEARMYAPLALLAVVSTYLVIRLVERPSGRGFALYAVLAVAAVYTQYYALFLLAAHGLAWLAFGWRHGRAAWLEWAAAELAVVLAFVPWLPIFREQTAEHRLTWLAEPSTENAPAFVGELVLGQREVGPGTVGYLLTVIVLALVVGAALRLALGRGREPAVGGWVVALWLLLPVGGAVAVSLLLTPILQTKQLLLALPAFYVLAAVALAPLARLTGALPLALLAGLVAVPGLEQGYFVYTKQDWRGLVGYIAEHRQPGDVVFLNPGASSSVLDYYMGQLRIVDLPRVGYPEVYEARRGNWGGERATPAVAEARVDELARDYRRVWVVQFSAAFWDPQLLLQKDMKERFVERPMPGFADLSTVLYETGK